MANTATQSGVKSALRTLDLLEFVVAHPAGVVAQDISAALAIPMSSLSYLLTTLVDREFLQKDGRRYVAGAGLDRLRRPVRDLSLEDRARPLIRALVQQINETTSLFFPVDREMKAVITETSSHALRYSIDVGTRSPLHCVAAGKALLAGMADEEIEQFLSLEPLRKLTPFTIVDKGRLIAELAAVRHSGIAYTQDEFTIGISGVGIALKQGGRPVAALGVGCPTARFDDSLKAVVRQKLQEIAAELEKGSLESEAGRPV